MNIANFVTRTRVLLGDQKEDEFTDAEYIAEVNAALLELNSELGFYVRSEALPLKEDVIDYELPDDCMKLKRLKLDGPRGCELPLYGSNDIPSNQNRMVANNNSYRPFCGSQNDLANYTQVAVRESSHNVISLSQAFRAEDPDAFPADGVWSE